MDLFYRETIGIYVVAADAKAYPDIVKVGRSVKSLGVRERQYGTDLPMGVWEIAFLIFPDDPKFRPAVVAAERFILSHLRRIKTRLRKNSEWVLTSMRPLFALLCRAESLFGGWLILNTSDMSRTKKRTNFYEYIPSHEQLTEIMERWLDETRGLDINKFELLGNYHYNDAKAWWQRFK